MEHTAARESSESDVPARTGQERTLGIPTEEAELVGGEESRPSCLSPSAVSPRSKRTASDRSAVALEGFDFLLADEGLRSGQKNVFGGSSSRAAYEDGSSVPLTGSSAPVPRIACERILSRARGGRTALTPGVHKAWESTVVRFQQRFAIGEAKRPLKSADGVPVLSLSSPLRRMRITADNEAKERTAQAWIEALTGQPFLTYGTRGFARNLKTGERLCSLINAIRPHTIRDVHGGHLGFEQMSNIEKFLAACYKLGVPTHALVDVADVFEMRDTAGLVKCVASCPTFEGPHLGLAADPSLIAAVPSEEDEGEASSHGSDDIFSVPQSGRERSDANVDGRWATSRQEAGRQCRVDSDGNGGVEGATLVLNMQDVERPRTIRRGFNTTVGSISDLQAPRPLSSRARKMCPAEIVNSPRALVYDADPIGHPARSPSAAALGASASHGVRESDVDDLLASFATPRRDKATESQEVQGIMKRSHACRAKNPWEQDAQDMDPAADFLMSMGGCGQRGADFAAVRSEGHGAWVEEASISAKLAVEDSTDKNLAGQAEAQTE